MLGLLLGLGVARTLNRLSARAAQTLQEPGLHADGGGLYLRINPANDKGEPGARRWVYIFRWRGKRTEMGLGSASNVLVKDARLARDEARKVLDAGKNPITERKLAKAEAEREPVMVPTFGEVADEWFEARKADWTSETTRARWTRIIEVHCLPLRPIPIDQVGTKDVEDALRPIWETIPDMAPRARGGIEDILDAAKVKGLRTGENPARWKGHLKHVLSAPRKLTRGHHPAMAYRDVPKFVAGLRARNSGSARLVEFTVLTAVRPSEAREASWGEFKLGENVWIIPAERMKERIAHRVPLTPDAIAVLDKLAEFQGREGWVFPGAKEGRPLSNGAGDKMMDLMGAGAFTVHGFRSSFRDWAGDCTDFPREVIEAALAHKVEGEVERAYRRGDALDKRRRLMEAWAEFLATLP